MKAKIKQVYCKNHLKYVGKIGTVKRVLRKHGKGYEILFPDGEELFFEANMVSII